MFGFPACPSPQPRWGMHTPASGQRVGPPGRLQNCSVLAKRGSSCSPSNSPDHVGTWPAPHQAAPSTPSISSSLSGVAPNSPPTLRMVCPGSASRSNSPLARSSPFPQPPQMLLSPSILFPSPQPGTVPRPALLCPPPLPCCAPLPCPLQPFSEVHQYPYACPCFPQSTPSASCCGWTWSP